jgi:hypothetical protein
MEWTGLIIAVVLLGVSIYINVNLLNKLENTDEALLDNEKYVEQLESWVKTFQTDISTAYNNMKQIDSRGSFEADDEVGTTFKTLKAIIEEVNDITNPNTDNEIK